MRPYTTARSVPASSRASVRIRSASIPVTRDPLRCPLGGHLAHAVQPVEVRLEVPHRDQIVGEQRLHHGQQQRRRPPA